MSVTREIAERISARRAEAQRLGLAADEQAALTSGLVGGSGVTQGQIRRGCPQAAAA
jgi:hypothetical protein